MGTQNLKMSKNVRIKERTENNIPGSKINKVKVDAMESRKNSRSYEEAMKDARARKASNYFDKENQEAKMEEISRRGSMFLSKDQRGSMLIDASRRRTISRQNEGDDSLISFTSSLCFDWKPKNQENWENTYKMEPDEKPKLGKIEEVVRNLIAITCEGQDYDYILPADLVERLNSAIHKAIKPLIPKRYRFTTQSFIFPRDGQDIKICSKWLWNPKTDSHITVKYEDKNTTITAITVCHFIYLE